MAVKKMSNTSPKISIVIPMYNVEDYIVQCLDSIASQKFSNLEVICVDDGSTDNTVSIVSHWRENNPAIKITLLQQTNKRQAAARNAAFDVARGEYIIMLDSDDVLFDNFINTLIPHIESSKPDVIAYNVVNWFPNTQNEYVQNTTYSHPEFRKLETGKIFLDYFVNLKHWGPTGMFYIFKRSLLEEHNLRFKEGIYHEDDLFIAQLCYWAKEVIVVPELKYCYRMREGSTMHSQTITNALNKFTAAYALEAFFQEQNYINPITRSIIFNVAANGLYMMKSLERYDMITGDRWHLVWRNASFKRRVKLVWRMLPIIFKK